MTNAITIKEFMRQDSVIQRFKDVLGDREASAYINSVLIAVGNDQKLQECTPISVVTSAMRAATLRLSVDPGTGEAYLVPFKGKCTLIVGYKGIKSMALRTGKYRYLNVAKIYSGEEVIEDRFTGMHTLAGGKKSDTVIGYMLYFELISGFRKSFYMTVEEIAEHAKRYSKSINFDDSPWKKEWDKMARKTVLRLGLSLWGYFDPHDAQLITQLETQEEEGIIDIDETDVIDVQPNEPKSEDQLLSELGF